MYKQSCPWAQDASPQPAVVAPPSAASVEDASCSACNGGASWTPASRGPAFARVAAVPEPHATSASETPTDVRMALVCFKVDGPNESRPPLGTGGKGLPHLSGHHPWRCRW
jgi:hypothetical protein